MGFVLNGNSNVVLSQDNHLVNIIFVIYTQLKTKKVIWNCVH